MGDFITETPNTIHIKVLETPIAGIFYIRDKYLKRAKETGKKLVLEYKGEKYIATYKEWMKGAKKMKKVFLLPDNPMTLWGNYLLKFKKKEKKEKVSILNQLRNWPDEYRLQIKAKLGLV